MKILLKNGKKLLQKKLQKCQGKLLQQGIKNIKELINRVLYLIQMSEILSRIWHESFLQETVRTTKKP